MTSKPKGLSIGDVAAATGLSVHAIRYFEREELLLREVDRSSARHRVFDDSDVEWLLLINKFRESGMPIATMRRFAHLVRLGPGTQNERLTLLREHQRAVETKIAALQDNLAVIKGKVSTYERYVREGTAVGVWDPRPASTTPQHDH